MTDISPKIPIDVVSLKETVRRGLQTNASRVYWWPYLPSVPATGVVDIYPDLIETAERLSIILGDIAPIPQEATKNKEKELIVGNTNSLLQVLVRSKILAIDETPNFDVLLRIIVQQLKRPDLSCMLSGDLLSNRDKYLDPDPEAHINLLNDFKEILNAFSPKTYMSLLSTGALEDRFLDMMFQDFFIELLPPEVVLRVIDAFLLEGNRILIRYGLAIIRAYKTQIKASTYNTATNFWLAVKADAANAATKANTPMYYKTLGREERLPTADPFVIFSKAKNPEFLETNLIFDYPFDEDRSMFSKIRRPMTLNTRKASFSSPLAALNNNSAGGGNAGNSPVNAGSTKNMSRKSSFTNSARSSVADMILSQNQNNTTTQAQGQGQDFGASASTSAAPAGATTTVPVLARRGSATGATFKQQMQLEMARRPSGPEGSPLPPAPATSSYTSPAPSQASSCVDNAPFSGGSALSPPPPQGGRAAVKKAEELQALELEAVASAMSFSSAILSSSTAQNLLEAINQPLPESYSLTFTTSVAQHGHSLSALYAHLQGSSPGIIALQLAAPYEHIVLGAYFDVPLSAREAPHASQHAGAFSINRGVLSYYARAATARPCIQCTPECLSFGGSAEIGTHALRIDERLEFAYSDASVTMGLPEESARFVIKEVEVFIAHGLSEGKGNNLSSAINSV